MCRHPIRVQTVCVCVIQLQSQQVNLVAFNIVLEERVMRGDFDWWKTEAEPLETAGNNNKKRAMPKAQLENSQQNKDLSLDQSDLTATCC